MKNDYRTRCMNSSALKAGKYNLELTVTLIRSGGILVTICLLLGILQYGRFIILANTRSLIRTFLFAARCSIVPDP